MLVKSKRGMLNIIDVRTLDAACDTTAVALLLEKRVDWPLCLFDAFAARLWSIISRYSTGSRTTSIDPVKSVERRWPWNVPISFGVVDVLDAWSNKLTDCEGNTEEPSTLGAAGGAKDGASAPTGLVLCIR